MSDLDDPTRLADSAETPAELRNLLSSARDDVPDEHQVRRVATRLGPLLGIGALGVMGQSALTAGGSAAQGGASATAVSALGIGKIAGVVLLGGALAGGAWWWSSARSAAQKATSAPVSANVRRPAPPAPIAKASPPVAEPSASEVSAEPSASAPEAHTAANANANPSEAQLLQRARAALATDPALALRLTQMHKQRFGNGQLAQEREVIAIDALERLNRGAEAKTRASQFHTDFPDSVHQRKVDEIAH